MRSSANPCVGEPGVRDPGDRLEPGVRTEPGEVGGEVPLVRGPQGALGAVGRGVAQDRRAARARHVVVALGRHVDGAGVVARDGHALGVRGARAVRVVQVRARGVRRRPAARAVRGQVVEQAVAVLHGPELPVPRGPGGSSVEAAQVTGEHVRVVETVSSGPPGQASAVTSPGNGFARSSSAPPSWRSRRCRRGCGRTWWPRAPSTSTSRRSHRPARTAARSRRCRVRSRTPPRRGRCSPRRDGGAGGDRVRVVVLAVAQDVPAEVDGGAAGVGQLDPVAGGVVVRLDLVDPHGRGAVVRSALGRGGGVHERPAPSAQRP